ncbi:MAG: universal stress protein [Nitrospinae bacterium]|nr:universal stress protein [Nitrospinota bacterium]
MKSAYKNILVAVPPPSFEWYRQPVDVIRKTSAALSMVPGVHLTFLSVYSVVADLGNGEVNLLPPEIFKEAVEEHEKKLKADVKAYVKWFTDNGIPHTIIMERGENPADTVIKCARDRKADLILIGRHHDHSIFDIFSPNVAEQIAKHAPCDVMQVSAGKQ